MTRRGPKSPATRSALGSVFRPVERAHGQVVPIRPQTAPAKDKPKFAPDPQRRTMIARIKIAQKELDFDDGDYRALLDRVTGKVSCTAMTVGELGRVLDEFKRLGWAPGRVAKTGGVDAASLRGPKPADHPAAKKARALWISLSLLGAIRQPSEAALEAFARRQMGCERFQWADQSQVYKVIEALKSFAGREGWCQSVAGLAEPVWTLKLRLCEAILRRLVAAGVMPPEATIGSVAMERFGLDDRVLPLTERDLETLAAWLGQLRAQRAAADHYED